MRLSVIKRMSSSFCRAVELLPHSLNWVDNDYYVGSGNLKSFFEWSDEFNPLYISSCETRKINLLASFCWKYFLFIYTLNIILLRERT